jgi:hypothetical protein
MFHKVVPKVAQILLCTIQSLNERDSDQASSEESDSREVYSELQSIKGWRRILILHGKGTYILLHTYFILMTHTVVPT